MADRKLDNTQMSHSLYSDMVVIASDFLGPTADRFLSRQIEAHLGISPSNITADDLPRLEGWLRISLGLLTEDKQSIEDFMSQINRLAK